jgi:hypothetical protein
MISTRLFRTPLHEHADPAQRILGVAELGPDSDELAKLLAQDPDAGVRAAAARRCAQFAALSRAWNAERDAAVREALEAALAPLVADTPDASAAASLLAAEHTTDGLRAEVARRARDPERRAQALAGLHDEERLVELAVSAPQAEARQAAAERVVSKEALEKLAQAANNKDRGVAKLAQRRLEAMKDRAAQESAADDILAKLEALATTPGPVLTAVVELNRRWQALDMAADPTRLARIDAARAALHARFEREQAEQLARARLEREVRDWSAALAMPGSEQEMQARHEELSRLKATAQEAADTPALEMLAMAEAKLAQWAIDREAVAGAEALVIEAERLAADTSIDDANLPARWQALDRAIRTPELSRRFEAALIVVEQRRLAQVAVAEQEASAARQKVHGYLHAAEEAIAAGQMQAARAAAEAIKLLKAEAGNLPKPTHQRISRVVQQLVELERWEAFGQHDARVRLIERAEALAAPGTDPAKVAQEVKKVREEWKALDAQHAGVPKALWERFDGACEKAYAPAARHFAEQAAHRKAARKTREDFIDKAAEEGGALLAVEPRDLRLMEQWVRDTEKNWREGNLGSVDPGAWKKLDAKFRETVGLVRQALVTARGEGKAGREALIAEVKALAETAATDREAPAKVKAIQQRWQAEAKAHPVGHRDERLLWEQFRAACDNVFEARNAKRKETDEKKGEGRRVLEEIAQRMDQLARVTEKAENDLRKEMREIEDAWRQAFGRPDPSLKGVESRFRNARSAVEALLKEKARVRESAVWQALAARERLCDELDTLAAGGGSADEATVREQWAGFAEVPGPWEKRMAARRDAALKALADGDADGHRAVVDKAAAARALGLLDLEMALGLESPPEFQQQRLALQVAKLRERFKSAASQGAEEPPDRLLAWCAAPGICERRDRDRFERILARMGPAR